MNSQTIVLDMAHEPLAHPVKNPVLAVRAQNSRVVKRLRGCSRTASGIADSVFQRPKNGDPVP